MSVNAKKKILFIVTQGEMGGAQKYVFDLATHLSENYEILVAMGQEKSGLQEALQKHGIRTAILTHLVRRIDPFHDLAGVWEIASLIRREKPDIVHLNSSKAGVVGSIGAFLAGCRNVIFTAHGLAFLEPNPKIVQQVYFWADKLTMPFRKKVIAVSDYDRTAALANNFGHTDKFVTIHNGLDFNSLSLLSREEARGKLGLSKTDFVIGCIANLYQTKGLEYLIEAAQMIRQSHPNLKYVVIGEGKERDSLTRKIQAAGMADDFHLPGAIPNASRLLPAFDLFVLPSVKEGFPYTILEAAAAGLPIVATTVGGVPEILKNNDSALLVPPKNPGQISGKILQLVNDPRFSESLGQNAKIQIRNFSLEKMVTNTEKVYESMN